MRSCICFFLFLLLIAFSSVIVWIWSSPISITLGGIALTHFTALTEKAEREREWEKNHSIGRHLKCFVHNYDRPFRLATIKFIPSDIFAVISKHIDSNTIWILNWHSEHRAHWNVIWDIWVEGNQIRFDQNAWTASYKLANYLVGSVAMSTDTLCIEYSPM